MKHLLKLGGLTPEEILHILDVADDYKRLHKDGIDPKDLQGKAVALVFAKNSTRTRTSLEVGIYQMGGLGTYLSANNLQTARGEPVQDTARGADVLFTDVWVSMGMEREAEQRRRDFTGFTLDAARMALAKPDCMVQHPLPAHRGEEIAPDVLEAHANEIFDEAENRIYIEKAVLPILLAGK